MRKGTAKVRAVITGICVIFLSTLLAYAGPPRLPVNRVNPRVLKAHPGVTMPKKIYKIEIVKFDLTGACRVRLVLQNKGTDLTVAQHGKSTLKVGQNQPISLSKLDPGKHLLKKGGTATYMEAKPLLKETNLTVEVTLFNGSKRSWTKLLKPTCKRPHLETGNIASGIKRREMKRKTSPVPAPGASKMFQPQPEPPGKPFRPLVGQQSIKKTNQIARKKSAIPIHGSNKMFQPQPEPPGQPMKPMSNKTTIKFPGPKAHVALRKTTLQVRRLGGDLATWDSYSFTDTSVQKVHFRWKTELESLHAARWQVSISPDFPYIIADGTITPIPPKGQYGHFSIDLSAFSGTYSKPAVFYVRVKPLKYHLIGKTGQSAAGTDNQDYRPSIPVRITLTEAGTGPQTQFNLPKTHLKVVFQKILVVEDGDDLSNGDLGFVFNVNGVEKAIYYEDDKYGDGDVIQLKDMVFVFTNPPNLVGLSVRGCDEDADPISEKLNELFHRVEDFESYCGNDKASTSGEIFTGTKLGRTRIPFKEFSLYATSETFKFEVHGYYEMYCDPCQ